MSVTSKVKVRKRSGESLKRILRVAQVDVVKLLRECRQGNTIILDIRKSVSTFFVSFLSFKSPVGLLSKGVTCTVSTERKRKSTKDDKKDKFKKDKKLL